MVVDSNCSDVSHELYDQLLDLDDAMIVSACEVQDSVNSLKSGKASGPDKLAGEHIKYCQPLVVALLAQLFTSMFIHGYMPHCMLQSVIVPIIKNNNTNINDKHNYRPICLSNICTKLVETVILNRIDRYLVTCENQFGFKSRHGTDLCVYALQELLRFYISHGSCMFTAFLDASKAFDRVNHCTLISKLCKSGVPMYVTRLIAYWYCTQSICVKWGTHVSTSFRVTNGVRQGGTLSPLLFNLYVNDLSVILNNLPVGCSVGNRVINHLLYADDIVLFAPSATASLFCLWL